MPTSLISLPGSLPSLGGDFFSYADREDNYWTGYFTSRPFHKYLGRVVEDRMRTVDLLFTLAKAVPDMSTAGRQMALASMTAARRELGLFQHHDGGWVLGGRRRRRHQQAVHRVSVTLIAPAPC